MFIPFSISSDFELWSVNHTSVYENSGSKVFKHTKHLDEISNNVPFIIDHLLGTNVNKTL